MDNLGNHNIDPTNNKGQDFSKATSQPQVRFKDNVKWDNLVTQTSDKTQNLQSQNLVKTPPRNLGTPPGFSLSKSIPQDQQQATGLIANKQSDWLAGKNGSLNDQGAVPVQSRQQAGGAVQSEPETPSIEDLLSGDLVLGLEGDLKSELSLDNPPEKAIIRSEEDPKKFVGIDKEMIDSRLKKDPQFLNKLSAFKSNKGKWIYQKDEKELSKAKKEGNIKNHKDCKSGKAAQSFLKADKTYILNNQQKNELRQIFNQISENFRKNLKLEEKEKNKEQGKESIAPKKTLTPTKTESTSDKETKLAASMENTKGKKEVKQQTLDFIDTENKQRRRRGEEATQEKKGKESDYVSKENIKSDRKEYQLRQENTSKDELKSDRKEDHVEGGEEKNDALQTESKKKQLAQKGDIKDDPGDSL